jgi:hypothetical protein
VIRTAAHYDALYREFRLILELNPSHLEAIPGRLLGLIDGLGTSFLGVGRAVEETWDTAVEEGRAAVDLYFRLPPEAGPAVLRYNQLLDGADEYCRRFELLTLAPSDEAMSVRDGRSGRSSPSAKASHPHPGPGGALLALCAESRLEFWRAPQAGDFSTGLHPV